MERSDTSAVNGKDVCLLAVALKHIHSSTHSSSYHACNHDNCFKCVSNEKSHCRTHAYTYVRICPLSCLLSNIVRATIDRTTVSFSSFKEYRFCKHNSPQALLHKYPCVVLLYLRPFCSTCSTSSPYVLAKHSATLLTTRPFLPYLDVCRTEDLCICLLLARVFVRSIQHVNKDIPHVHRFQNIAHQNSSSLNHHYVPKRESALSLSPQLQMFPMFRMCNIAEIIIA